MAGDPSEGEAADAARRAEALASEQEQAAAQEAGDVGGRNPDPDVDPAERPLREAGEGESEGFEQAEQALIDQASHAGPGTSPSQDAFTPETEADLESIERGEADREGRPDG